MKIKTKLTPIYLMLLPGCILTFIFCYIPMVGIVVAFENYNSYKGFFDQEWVGLDNFRYLFALPDFFPAIRNTLLIASMKIVLGIFVPLIISLFLNEVKFKHFAGIFQTMTFSTHFLSWVILGGMLITVLSPTNGSVNSIIKFFGFKSIYFLGEPGIFPYVAAITAVWKEYGFSTILYTAAITGIGTEPYEASIIDGAGRFKRMWYITIPGMKYIVILLSVLSLGSILDAGFDQIFNIYSPIVYSTGDIIDTLIYRIGFEQGIYHLAGAFGLMRSIIGTILISTSWYLAKKYSGYRIF